VELAHTAQIIARREKKIKIEQRTIEKKRDFLKNGPLSGLVAGRSALSSPTLSPRKELRKGGYRVCKEDWGDEIRRLLSNRKAKLKGSYEKKSAG